MLRSLVVHKVARLGLSSQVDPWSKMSVKALKVECKNRNLKVSGKKVELIKRLREAQTINGSKIGSRIVKEQDRVVVSKPVESKIASKNGGRIEQERVVVPKRMEPLKSGSATVQSRRNELMQPTELKDKHLVNNSSRTTNFHHPKQKARQLRSLNQMAGLEHSAKVEDSLKEPIVQEQQEKHTQFPGQDDSKRLILQTNNDSTIHPKYAASPRRNSPAYHPEGLQDKFTDQLSFRDKFFLFTSITSIILWWWLPYVPSVYLKILTSYKYLQSFF